MLYRIAYQGLSILCQEYFSLFLTGNLSGSSIVEFSAGMAAFTDISIDYEGKNYTLFLESFTIPPSRYQFSQNTDPFHVNERVLALVITQQPGKPAVRFKVRSS